MRASPLQGRMRRGRRWLGVLAARRGSCGAGRSRQPRRCHALSATMVMLLALALVKLMLSSANYRILLLRLKLTPEF